MLGRRVVALANAALARVAAALPVGAVGPRGPTAPGAIDGVRQHRTVDDALLPVQRQRVSVGWRGARQFQFVPAAVRVLRVQARMPRWETGAVLHRHSHYSLSGGHV
jgi:hypothetical protein